MDNSTTESESDDSSSLESKQVQNGEDLERELRELFEYLDADRDSVLDKDEFERAFFELEIFLETSELDRLFKKYSSTVYPDGEVGVNYHHFRAVLRELTKRRETKKRSFLSARKLVRVLSRIGHMKNSLRDTIRTSIVKVMSPKRSSAKSKIKSKKSMWDVTSIEKDQLRLVFDHMDGDKSGDVNRVEMVRTLRHLGMYQSIGQIDNLFEKVTGSKDGKIRFEHFCELIMHTRTAHRTISYQHLSRRISKGFTELISRVPKQEVIKAILDMLTFLVVLGTLWETVYFVFIRNRDFEVEWNVYVLDVACVIICLFRVLVLKQSNNRRNKIVPHRVVEEDENEEDDEDDSNRPSSPKIKRNQSLRALDENVNRWIPDNEVATFVLSRM